jgi:hypothetical protein
MNAEKAAIVMKARQSSAAFVDAYLKMKMNRINREKKVATLSMVRSITT